MCKPECYGSLLSYAVRLNLNCNSCEYLERCEKESADFWKCDNQTPQKFPTTIKMGKAILDKLK